MTTNQNDRDRELNRKTSGEFGFKNQSAPDSTVTLGEWKDDYDWDANSFVIETPAELSASILTDTISGFEDDYDWDSNSFVSDTPAPTVVYPSDSYDWDADNPEASFENVKTKPVAAFPEDDYQWDRVL
jgi:hypothetical protein